MTWIRRCRYRFSTQHGYLLVRWAATYNKRGCLRLYSIIVQWLTSVWHANAYSIVTKATQPRFAPKCRLIIIVVNTSPAFFSRNLHTDTVHNMYNMYIYIYIKQNAILYSVQYCVLFFTRVYGNVLFRCTTQLQATLLGQLVLPRWVSEFHGNLPRKPQLGPSQGYEQNESYCSKGESRGTTCAAPMSY